MNFFRRRNSKSKKDESIIKNSKSPKLPPQAPPQVPNFKQEENKSKFGISNSSQNHTKHNPNYNFQQHGNNNNDINLAHHPSLSLPNSPNPNPKHLSSPNDSANAYHSLNSEAPSKSSQSQNSDQSDIKKPNKFLSPRQSSSNNPYNNNIQRNNGSYDNDDGKSPPDLTLAHSLLTPNTSNTSNETPMNLRTYSSQQNDSLRSHSPFSMKRTLSSKHKRKKKSLFHSRSISNSSVAISARSMVSISNSALSLLDYGIERSDVESACCTLMDLTFSIRAVWVVARPIDRASMATRRFEHWCLKIHAQPALISMDFFESGGKGAFGISSVCASWTELEDFLHYHFTDYETQKQIKKPWKIISSVVPRKYDKLTNLEKHMLPLEIGKHAMGKGNENNNNGINKIKCDYKVRDLADFIEEWADDHRAYNSLGTNCQRFVYDVYKFLIGDYYPQKVKILDKHLQSPLDRQKEKLNRLKNHQDPRLNRQESEDDDEDDQDDDDYKEQVINNGNEINVKDNNIDDSGDKKDEQEVNNPEANVLVQSLDFTTQEFMNQLEQDDNTVDID
eukprot:CAMPEP_0201577838 /NCGR_PEP_ID=MMETSP0190_2-20130828/24399_1 /ASSEMBLY_ACC=CAM_ASM_000263 /TAXON_ID=37353 /ORGANISM="Rosalina sp." /LENGTH=560 /DNA_ID=CAMNT_0048010321 /DNA_START=46 /DNA_END=1728 /DNA_ORIENTATION=+